jgi:hypothetical protein
MKSSALLSFLRGVSYVGCFVIVASAVLAFWQGCLGLPIAGHPSQDHHIGIGLWKFDFSGVPDGVKYRGARNDSFFFSNGEVQLNVGQEGTPVALISLVRWQYAGISLLLLLPATILWQFGRWFGAVKNGESFSLQSVRRIRLMGGCCLAFFGLGTLFNRVLFHQLAADFPLQQLGANFSVHPQSPRLDFTSLWLGLFAFALAEVLRQGLLLKQESDLTV